MEKEYSKIIGKAIRNNMLDVEEDELLEIISDVLADISEAMKKLEPQAYNSYQHLMDASRTIGSLNS